MQCGKFELPSSVIHCKTESRGSTRGVRASGVHNPFLVFSFLMSKWSDEVIITTVLQRE
jgi:hypothetical protein